MRQGHREPTIASCAQANRREDWIFPKGGWELNESAEEAALREAHEEAGVRGRIIAPLAVLEHASRKGKTTRLHSYLVEVDEVLTEYRESGALCANECFSNDTPVTRIFFFAVRSRARAQVGESGRIAHRH